MCLLVRFLHHLSSPVDCSHFILSWINSQQKYFHWLQHQRRKGLEIIKYPTLKTAYFCTMKSNPLAFFSPKKKPPQFIHFKLSTENIALFWSHKQFRHYICSLEISLWGCESYFFAISDKHRPCSSLIMPTPFKHPAHVWPSHMWAGPCVKNPFMWHTLIRNKKSRITEVCFIKETIKLCSVRCTFCQKSKRKLTFEILTLSQ